jgi:hypothetical protein
MISGAVSYGLSDEENKTVQGYLWAAGSAAVITGLTFGVEKYAAPIRGRWFSDNELFRLGR